MTKPVSFEMLTKLVPVPISHEIKGFHVWLPQKGYAKASDLKFEGRMNA